MLPVLTIIKRLAELRRLSRLPRAQFEARKLEKFRSLVQHAQRHSPYYANIISERGIDPSTCLPTDFPVLTKAELMANFDRIVTDKRITKAIVEDFLTKSTDPNELLFNTYHVIHTSGSSGEVGYFLFTDAEWFLGMFPAGRRENPRERLRRTRFGRLRIAYYAAVGGHFAGVSMMSTAKRGIARLFVKVRMFEINSPLPQIIDDLNTYQPDLLGGYTTGIKILAEKQLAGELRISPIGVATAGECMTHTDQELIEQAFHCRVGNGYGSTEHLMMGAANPDGKTMTLYDTDLIYEIFNDHTLVTNLFDRTMPLIRYRMSDILRPVENPNPASPFLVVNSLVGRTEKIPVFINRNGVDDFIHPISVVELFIAGVTRFQMRLVDKTFFRFAIVLDQNLNEEENQQVIENTQIRLREFLNQKQMDNVKFEVQPVTEIPVDQRTGKMKIIVDDVLVIEHPVA